MCAKFANPTWISHRGFTDWSRRPLTEAQAKYAVGDVTFLRDIYEHLSARLDKSGRKKWVAEEMAVLNDPATYRADPDEAWRRVKTRTNSGRFLGILRELARFREAYAQERNVPRSRVFKDDALVEIASTKPQNEQDLSRSRLLLREARRGDIAQGILAGVKAGLALPNDALPCAKYKPRQVAGQSGIGRYVAGLAQGDLGQ